MKPMFGFRNTFIYDAEGNPCYKTWSMGAFVDKAAGKLKRVDDATIASMTLEPQLEMNYRDRLYGTTDNMSGYADITIRDQRGHKVFGGIVDFYSLVPATGIRFLSPMLAKGKYTLELRIASMKPNWTDKRRNQYGSTGHKVEITHVMIE